MRALSTLCLALLLLPQVLGCDCQGGPDIHKDEATVAKHYIGTSDSADPGLFTDTPAGDQPEEAEVSIDFGAVAISSTAVRYLFFKNTGNATLNVVGVEWETPTAAFSVACLSGGAFAANCPYTTSDFLQIGPGADLVIQINYAPGEVADHSADFVIHSNAADYPAVRVHLAGQGSIADLQVCISDCTGDQVDPACAAAAEVCHDVRPDLTILFGDIDAGETLTRTVTLRSTGELPVDVGLPVPSGGDFNQFAVNLGAGLPGSLAPGSSATLEVDYHPIVGGEHLSDLMIPSNDSLEHMITVHLNGRALAPRVCPDPFSLDFQTVAVGESRELFFTLANCGLRDLQVTNLIPASNSSPDFDLVNPPGLPFILSPGASIEVHVAYSPGDRGSDTGGIEIYSNDPSSDPGSGLTGTVALRGNGMVRECDIQATPFAANWGGVVRETSETLVLFLSNQGNHTCTVNGFAITQNSADNEFSILAHPAEGTSFEPGDVLQVELVYAPVAEGIDTGVLTITGTDKDGPEIPVSLSGEGVLTASCDARVTPSTLRFGTVKVSNTQSLVVTVQNLGNATCSFSAPNLSHVVMPGFASDFAQTRGPVAPFVLAKKNQPNDRVEIEISFAPASVNMHFATLSFHTDDDLDTLTTNPMCYMPDFMPAEAGDACISISGMSAESDIEVVPAELDFGVVTVGCNSPEMYVRIYNLGTAELNISDIYLEVQDGNFEIRQAPALPFVLSGGNHTEIRLRYHPQDTNAHRNTLYIQSDASNVDLLAVPLYGRGTLISTQTDVFHQPTQVKSDVLFAVDNSGSMDWAQSQLAGNFSAFINYATQLDVDYHIGVIATEVNEAESGYGDPPRDVYPGVLVQAPGRPKIITNATPDVNAAFADNVNVGLCCSDEQEAGLQASWMALSPPLIEDASANAGFLREDAKLYIVCVSDEQDQSNGEPDFYVDFFQHIKGPRNTEMLKVSAIDQDASLACNPNGSAGSRYVEVANRTGGIVEDICTSNWAQALQNLGIDAFAAIREFPLSRPADESTITVTVNGVPVPEAGAPGGANGWTYYADSNTIYFGDDVIPDKGDRIEVSYTAECL